MKEWQIRHKIFHQVLSHMDMGDDLSKETIIEEKDQESIIRRAIDYPSKQTKELYYPGKSYAVAIIFAKLLEKYFQEDFYESLNNSELLYQNDPYFIPYSDDQETYDQILAAFPFHLIENPALGCENFQKTCEYFLKEFLLHEQTKIYLPS